LFIVRAEKGGFCFGVRRAVDAVYKEAEGDRPVFTWGPIIHNAQVVGRLEELGVKAAERPEDIPEGSTVVIRSHGVGEDVIQKCGERGLEVVDATCPCVKRIQAKAVECSRRGVPVVIIGEREHPEVEGIAGWCGGLAHVVHSEEDVAALPEMPRACVVAQTTTPRKLWERLVALLSEKIAEPEVFPSICNATEERQGEAAELAGQVDCIVVVGGRNSSNTKKLYEICSRACPRTLWVGEASELPEGSFRGCERAAIISGASTPDWIIEEVCAKMSEMDNRDDEVREETAAPAAEPAGEQEAPETVPEADAAEQEAVPGEASEAESAPDAEPAEKPKAARKAKPKAVESEPEAEAQSEPAPKAEQEAAPEAGEEAEAESAPPPPAKPRNSFEEAFEKTMKPIHAGQVVKGTIVQVTADEVCVNIGYKADGVITKDEYSSDPSVDLLKEAHEGDEIEVEILRINDGEGNVALSLKNLEIKRGWKQIMEDFEAGNIVKGMGKQVVKGGLIALIYGVRAFIPASQLDSRYVEDIAEYVNKELELKILEVEKHRHRVVASRKAVLETERQKHESEIWDMLKTHEGEMTRGIVRRLTDFGAFVEVAGVDGLVHVTDLAWGRVKHPRDVVAVGDEIDVVVLRVDTERKRLSLSAKQAKPRPWDTAPEKYHSGEIVEGKVVRIVSFGAFVELEPGLDGLVHISQVSDRHIEKVEDVLRPDQMVMVKILDVNPADKRISLSIREAAAELQAMGGMEEPEKEPEEMPEESAEEPEAE
jgi:(E)-4-hydroxy-3-methyl-but-2-enyl pyrophosphate reductase